MIINLVCHQLDRTPGGVAVPRGGARIVAGRNATLSAIMDDVVAAARHRRSIWLLRILAHGNSGFINLGRESLTRDTATCFKALRDYFTPGGIGVALHSCGPASHTSIVRDPNWLDRLFHDEDEVITVPGSLAAGGGRGIDFLKALASVAAVSVRGGIHTQTTDARYRYEGPSVVVSPTGSMVAVADWGRLALDTQRIIATGH